MSPITPEAKKKMGETLLIELKKPSLAIDGIRHLIRLGADMTVTDAKGNNAAILIAGAGSYSLLKEILDHGTDVNQVGENGNTVLHILVVDGNKEAVKKVLSMGADVTVRNNDGRTPGDYARSQGDNAMAELIEKEYKAKKAVTDAKEAFDRALSGGLPVEQPFQHLKPLQLRPRAARKTTP